MKLSEFDDMSSFLYVLDCFELQSNKIHIVVQINPAKTLHKQVYKSGVSESVYIYCRFPPLVDFK